MLMPVRLLSSILCLTSLPCFAAGVVYEGGEGPGRGKHIVLISGDEEYRSEEALPQLGKILAKHHGFKCTVLFPIDPQDGQALMRTAGAIARDRARARAATDDAARAR